MSSHRGESRIGRRAFLRRTAQAGLAAGLCAAAACSPRRIGPSALPNVVLLSLDTTRADHMSCFGYPRLTTPNLDGLAGQSLFFTRSLTTSSWTLPSHATMFTGKFVTSHGARKVEEGAHSLSEAFGPKQQGDLYRVSSVSPDELLLAEILRDAGYATGAVVAGPWLKKQFGLARGFDYHDDQNIEGLDFKQKRIGMEVTVRAIEWLKKTESKPFFLFLNYFDAHTPYVFPNQFLDVFKEQPVPTLHEIDQKEYDISLNFMDWSIGALLKNLKETSRYDNTLIVIVGDHGEQFGEHGASGHGMHLYQGSVHVPFFVKYPSGEVPAAVRREFVQPTEIEPLILDRLGLPIPTGVQGSRLDAITHPILAEEYPGVNEPGQTGHWKMLVRDDMKLLHNSLGNHELYDLKNDPKETVNLIETESDRAALMMADLVQLFDSLPRPAGRPALVEIDSKSREELEAVGYL